MSGYRLPGPELIALYLPAFLVAPVTAPGQALQLGIQQQIRLLAR
ncbi:MAG: hypothetical protein ABIH03_15470 [Pseudomonadota bacterium]